MNVSRYPFQCYVLLKSLDDDGKTNWVSYVRRLLCETGFTYIWLCQDVGDKVVFLDLFKRRLKDIYFQTWHQNLESSGYLVHYATIKSLLQPEPYISLLRDKQFKKSALQI